MSAAPASTVDDAEIRRFSAMAAEWWNPAGKFRPLHKFNPVRLGYIKQEVSARFDSFVAGRTLDLQSRATLG